MTLDRVFIGRLEDGFIESPEAAAHVQKVLRLRIGDMFAGYDGCNEYELQLLGVRGSGLKVEVTAMRELPLPGARITLAPAVLKGHRWEMMLEKAVELGVSRILPVAAERCVAKFREKDSAAKTDRWKKIMQAACAQCAGRVPVLEAPASFSDVVKNVADVRNRFILCAGEGTQPAAALQCAAGGEALILVGPEGDWTGEEVSEAMAAGFVRVGLGDRILRAETAALAALVIASAGQGK